MMRMFAAGVLLTFTIVGCTAQVNPVETPGVDDHQPVAIPAGPVATATLIAVDGATVGDVTIAREATGYVIDYPDIDRLGEDIGVTHTQIAMSDSPFTVDECGDANIWQIGWDGDDIRTAPFLGDYPDEDWSFFTSVLVIGFREVGSDGCTQPILATGELTWNQPVVRPWVDPVDSGPADGASGPVDGSLYTTAPGDIWSAVAARFGIDSDDLTWLNPIRAGNSERNTAYAGQVLNLDPADRSDSESRRP
jgi:hypothetical protein